MAWLMKNKDGGNENVMDEILTSPITNVGEVNPEKTPENHVDFLLKSFQVRGGPEWDEAMDNALVASKTWRFKYISAILSAGVLAWTGLAWLKEWSGEGIGLGFMLFMLFVICTGAYTKGAMEEYFQRTRYWKFLRWSKNFRDFTDVCEGFLNMAKRPERTVSPALIAFAEIAHQRYRTQDNDAIMYQLQRRVGENALHESLTCFMKAYYAMIQGAKRVGVTREAEEHLFAVIEASRRPLGAHEVIIGMKGEEEVFPIAEDRNLTAQMA